jgi:aryl-alcohol dehydrogenase-like predicted oxidoreductase
LTTRKSELVLGTAQLAMPYGILAPEPAPSTKQSFAILDRAWTHGIRAFDSAVAYGDAEQRIARWIATRGNSPRIITKIPAIPAEIDTPFAFVTEHLGQIVTRLRGATLEAVLAHRATDIFRPGTVEALSAAERDGRIGKWGVSIYTAGEFSAAIAIPGISVVEAPINVLDSRLKASGLLASAADRGIEVVARSVFLQGTLLRPPDTVPLEIPGLRNACAALARIAVSHGVACGALALAAAKAATGVSKIVVGAANADQIASIAGWWNTNVPIDAIAQAVALGHTLDESALDPRQWLRFIDAKG